MNQCKQQHQHIITGLYGILMAGWLILGLMPLTAHARIDCSTLPHWETLENQLKINQKHVFCGEWDRNRAKGFHARPKGQNPDTVAHFTVQDKPNAAGIYTGRWSYQGQSGKNKFSSMFPDSCSAKQVLNSIAYAASHQHNCPAGAPDWARCGPNQPSTDTKEVEKTTYCNVGNQRFTISFAPPRDGKINTAFPLFE